MVNQLRAGAGKGRRGARLDNNLGVGLLCANLAFLFYSENSKSVCVYVPYK